MHLIKALAFILINCALIKAIKVSCKNEQNKDVDWYYLYKLPKHYSNEIDSDLSGLRYSYVTSDSFQNNNWQFSDIQIDNAESFPGRTISKLLVDEDVLLLLYNDEVPDGPVDFENGHTKGVVATDGIYAIWIVHSVPKYPKTSQYGYPATGEHFGQSFLCVTFNATTQMNSIVTQLLFNQPNIYFSRIPGRLSHKYPDLGRVIAKQWRSVAPFHNVLELQSLNGSIFQTFAKGRKSNIEIYKDLVAPILNVDLMVETWRNGPGNLPSDCSTKTKVYNIALIENNELGFLFKTTMDHSKWAVSKVGKDGWICVGDINRSEHQLFRGGGTVCQKNIKLANIYRSMIRKFENCTQII